MLLQRARTLRREPTEAERRFWGLVRNRRLGGLKFRRQVPVGPYIADFFCAECRLIVELDGSQHADRGDADRRRTRYLESKGYFVLRFWNADLRKNPAGVRAGILAAAGLEP